MNYEIGIDPDTQKSGVCIWDKELKTIVMAKALPFFEVIELLATYKLDKSKKMIVRIEAGWLNKKSNFHGGKTDNIKQRIAKNVGANHQIGKLFEEYCTRVGINYSLEKPTTAKWSREECQRYTGLALKNQDVIDAVRLVYQR